MNPENRSIPRNPNQKMSDEEIDALLEMAAAQVNGSASRENIELRKKEEKKQAEASRKRIEEIQKKAAEEERKKEQLAKEEARKKELAAKEEARKKEEARRKELAAKEEARKKEEARRKELAAKEEARKKEEARRKELAAKEEARKKEEARQKELAAKEEARKKEEAGRKELADTKKPEKKETPVKSEQHKKTPEKTKEDKTAHIEMDDVYITETEENPYKEKWTVGRVIGTFFETIWTIFKVAVIVLVVTVISGFFLSRDLMIRGRSGERLSVKGMTVAANVASNKSLEKTKVKSWKKTVEIQKRTLEADDGKIMVARSFTKGGNKWVVVLHGYSETMEDVYDIAMHYSEDGYNILIPDLRANGESEGSFYGMGWLDRLDVINWIDQILEENPSAQVAIHGVDVGADTALMLAGEPLKSNIKVVVAEGAYTSAWEVLKKEYKLRHPKLPVFPFLYMMNPVMKVWAGYSLGEADATAQVKKAKIPILLIDGNNDTYVDGDMAAELDQAIASKHELITIANGSHGDCRYADSDTYYDKALNFVNDNLD